ncbi:MAG: hypothetical protein JNM94_03885 [Phycisphaerae bacterium]|nr:hypothetical protein [Phycisphaerae bacterium]
MTSERPADEGPDDTHALTWAALLAHWLDVAKATVALPDQGDAGRWKRSLPHLIELHATALALTDITRLRVEDRAVARDKADVLAKRANAQLQTIWRGVPMAEDIVEAQEAAARAIRRSLYAGLVELYWPGPGILEVPDLDLGDGASGSVGTLAVMPPGSLAMPREPVAWFAERPPIAIEGCVAREADEPRQVYREIGADGRFVRDLVAPIDGDLLSGLPMLVVHSLAGTPIGLPPKTRDEWLRLQRGAMPGADPLPVIEMPTG